MDEAGFTREEWKVDGLAVKVNGRGTIANIPTPQNGGVMECSANVNLIAAAPDMFAVIEEWLTVGNDMAARKAIREKARAALSLARGEQFPRGDEK